MERLRERQRFHGTPAGVCPLSIRKQRRATTLAAALCSRDTKMIRQTVAPQLGKLFGRMPKAPFEIRTIEEFRERSAPSQYWSATPDGSRPGIFYINASGIEKRPRRASEPLFLHEADARAPLPDLAATGAGDLPRFQRFGEYTAFIEGWALYAESLGAELRTVCRAGAIFQPAQLGTISRGSPGRRRRLARKRMEPRRKR